MLTIARLTIGEAARRRVLWVLTALDGGKERLEAAGAAYAPLA